MTLGDLRTLVKQLLGQRVISTVNDTTWYNDRVNAAYRRLSTFQGYVTAPGLKQPAQRILRFHELENMTARTLNVAAFPLSTNFVQPSVANVYTVMDVYDRDNDRWLQRVPVKYMRRLDPDETGTPLRWTPGGDGANTAQAVGYYVHPKPTAGSSEEIAVYEYTYRYPTALSTDGNSPVIPEVWHPAIAYAAASEGALLLDWRDRHADMEQRFMAYVAERKSPYEEGAYSGGRRYMQVGGY